MPIVRIDMYKGRSQATKKAILDAVHNALVEAFRIPDDDRNQLLHEFDEQDFERKPSRSKEILIIEIVAFKGRSRETKKLLFSLITSYIEKATGIPPNDVLICINEQPLENWGIRGIPADELDMGYSVTI